MTELPRALTALQRLIARGDMSAQEALDAQRRRLAALDSALGCVVWQPPASEAAPAQGPLAGIGLAHKDNFDTEGRRPGVGHDRGAHEAGRREARALARLRERGAGHLAQVAMTEYACGATGLNAQLGDCRNPLHPQAIVGGSSSGSGVAVAGGLAYGSLGTDTAGSVRIPAACCGVVGLKTTHGLVSREGLAPLAPSLDSVGVLARTPADAAELLAAVAEAPLAPPVASPAGLCVRAVIPGDVDPRIAQALHDFVSRWPRAQVDAELEGEDDLRGLAEVLLQAEAAEVHRAALLARQAGPVLETVALPGLLMAPHWVATVRAQRAARLRAFVDTYLRHHELLLLPTLCHPVPDREEVTPGHPRFDRDRLLGLYRHMGFVNYLGLPSLALPVAADARGLPISVQVIARPFHDARLLQWAAWVDEGLYGGQGFAAPRANGLTPAGGTPPPPAPAASGAPVRPRSGGSSAARR